MRLMRATGNFVFISILEGFGLLYAGAVEASDEEGAGWLRLPRGARVDDMVGEEEENESSAAP